ncbi:MAG: hypothetical protein ACJAYE_001741 [Candidatus Azotimanducaceae bacterium]|jgi:hypothetical protein
MMFFAPQRLLALLVLVLFSGYSLAHKLAPSLLAIQETTSNQFELQWKTPRTLPTQERIELHLPNHCADLSERQPVPDPVGIVFEWRVDCGDQGLVGSVVRVSGLAGNQSAAVVKIDLLDGRAYRQLLNGSQPEFLVPERVERGAVIRDYAQLGAEHILGGIDHLFFVWALMLMLSRRKLLIAITAFTLGHSVTLALAALEFVSVPQALTEFFIALSIFVLAAEMAKNKMNQNTLDNPVGLIQKHAFWVCVAFGLLHGLGFAGALRDIGLPQEEVLTALLMFNVGVEIGQLLFLGIVIAIGAAISRAMAVISRSGFPVIAPERWLWLPIYLIGSGSAYWCIERTLGVLV